MGEGVGTVEILEEGLEVFLQFKDVLAAIVGKLKRKGEPPYIGDMVALKNLELWFERSALGDG